MTENEQTLEYLRAVRAELVGSGLPPSFAKLYSQYTRLRMNQPGLKGWREEEFSDRLADAIILIDAGLSEREVGGDGWRDALIRSGELLEWLSHPDLNTERLPLSLLAAGLYQLAGYPALAVGLLSGERLKDNHSKILIALLRGDFPQLFSLGIDYWSTDLSVQPDRAGTFRQTPNVSARIVDEVVKALGILVAYMRWGDSERLDRAQQKLQAASRLMIYSTDTYSWLLSKIVSEVVREYVNNSMRVSVRELQNAVSDHGKQAFERYLRSTYRARKSIVWPSQVSGIERLLQDGSFALCTPTGSGKTTVAEIAIIQSLFHEHSDDMLYGVGRIVMYLVPSRALATEVETKLGNVLGNLGNQSVKVTGLYGGIDWGPTDAWVTTSDPTVLICTYEKAEALIRFLGPLFLKRVSLVVVDEAHFVQFNGSNYDDLRNGDERSLRLEMLVTRLLRYVSAQRIIALSAVAERNESLAQWVTGDVNSVPVIVEYRSTRQLIGRLEWSRSGDFEIHYDVLNGSYLGFDDEGDGRVPYIPRPFSAFPVAYQDLHSKYTGSDVKIDKRQRAYLFWAAMQLAQPDEHGNQHSVLISVTQNVGGYAEDFLFVLNDTLNELELPLFFQHPSDKASAELFQKSLNACTDYFGSASLEYQLLGKGIVVHHGNMPGLLARLLVELLQKGIVHIAIATSTLSEGINLPFETVIVPTLIRNRDTLSTSEFLNLAGRAGRPGWGTEGRTLVLLESGTRERSSVRARHLYNGMIEQITAQRWRKHDATVKSPLEVLMLYMFQAWTQVSGSTSEEQFMGWLETTVPLENPVTGLRLAAEESLDSLDGHLLSVLVESEAFNDEGLAPQEVEQRLRDVWQNTYARYVASQADFWGKVFATRGQAVRECVYRDTGVRRRLYRTSVAPRYGKRILDGYKNVRQHLETGLKYPEWSTDDRLNFIIQTVRLVSGLGKFKVADTFGTGKNRPTWDEILTWWLNPQGAGKTPTIKQVARWVKFVKHEFEYKFNWGLGTVLALIFDDVNDGVLEETSIEDWPKTGLPWIVFWLKELITWGTLDPVATMLLANGIEDTRSAAETKAQDFYNATIKVNSDDVLNASRIKEWVSLVGRSNVTAMVDSSSRRLVAWLKRDFGRAKVETWRVMPVIKDGSIVWVDIAGYVFATSDIPNWWHDSVASSHDFVLNCRTGTVEISRFL